MVLLASILADESHRHPLLVLQSSLAQTSLPILRHLLSHQPSRKTLLFSFLYPPSSLVDIDESDSLEIYDWIDRVPGYSDHNSLTELLAVVDKVLETPTRPTTIVIDSIGTLLEDIATLSETYNFLSKIYALVKKHSDARLVLHSQSPLALLPLITQTGFSSSLSHVIVHPPALLAHLATEFLMPPPPISPLPKFWSVFLPLSERVHDTERLVFGSGGEGTGNPTEFVVELIVREGAGRNRGIERVLEGWSIALHGPCDLVALEVLKPFTEKKHGESIIATPDPTQNLPFNLTLTSSQQESRAQVPLPYAHEGTRTPITANAHAAIFYDPDSADDIDDDDPDVDLDI
ncbi:hypothetical protein M413DRAFT_62641 [Hebeloma cylindrosporum]|uniref:Elongator complex protein 5 n=1 Tax=Hebeloma cylindrosporum TaxID=76867 RepID=A0A0C3CHH0_HEBCY|nr:hypothetical protein M413DRAFT_62641 [Hebeloma cylindrosporum h7]